MALSLNRCSELPFTGPNLTHAREEDEHVAGGGPQGVGHSLTNEGDQIATVAMPEILYVHGKHPPLGVDGRACSSLPCPEQAGDWVSGERGAHHDDPQIWPHGLPEPHEQAQHEIHLQ